MAPHSTPVGCGLGQSLVTRQEKINDACSLLIQFGFHREVFTINKLHDQGYTDNDFLELIKPITSIADLVELREFFNITRQYMYFALNDLPKFIDFLKWLNGTEQGKKVMAEISKQKNLKEKKEMTKADVALAKKFADYATPRTLACKRMREEIEGLKKRQMELEVECANMDADLKTKLGPLYGYEEPSLNELRIDAYKLYEEDCKSKRIVAIPKHDEMGFKKAIELFGEVVKERKFVNYLNDPVRKDNIAKYLIVSKFVCDITDGVSKENEVHGGTAKKMKSEF